MTTKQALLIGLVIGVTVGICYMKLHYACPGCQGRAKTIQRKMAQFMANMGLKYAE